MGSDGYPPHSVPPPGGYTSAPPQPPQQHYGAVPAPGQPQPLNTGRTAGEQIGGVLSKVGDKVVQGIQYATPKVQDGIRSGERSACERIVPNEEESEVDAEKVRKLRGVTSTAARVSGKAADKFVDVARRVGHRVGGTSEAAREQGKRPGDVRTVVGAALGAAAGVLEAGTGAAKETLGTACDSGAAVAGHKYGQQAQEATREGLGCVEDVVRTGLNVHQIGPAGFVKAAGKQAAKEQVGYAQPYGQAPQQQQQQPQHAQASPSPSPSPSPPPPQQQQQQYVPPPVHQPAYAPPPQGQQYQQPQHYQYPQH